MLIGYLGIFTIKIIKEVKNQDNKNAFNITYIHVTYDF